MLVSIMLSLIVTNFISSPLIEFSEKIPTHTHYTPMSVSTINKIILITINVLIRFDTLSAFVIRLFM